MWADNWVGVWDGSVVVKSAVKSAFESVVTLGGPTVALRADLKAGRKVVSMAGQKAVWKAVMMAAMSAE